MSGMEGAIVALLLYLVMVATGLVANMRNGGCHCCSSLVLGHGCIRLKANAWDGGTIVSNIGGEYRFDFKQILEKWFKVDV